MEQQRLGRGQDDEWEKDDHRESTSFKGYTANNDYTRINNPSGTRPFPTTRGLELAANFRWMTSPQERDAQQHDQRRDPQLDNDQTDVYTFSNPDGDPGGSIGIQSATSPFSIDTLMQEGSFDLPRSSSEQRSSETENQEEPPRKQRAISLQRSENLPDFSASRQYNRNLFSPEMIAEQNDNMTPELTKVLRKLGIEDLALGEHTQFNERGQNLNEVTSKLQATLKDIKQDKKVVTSVINSIKQSIDSFYYTFKLIKRKEEESIAISEKLDELRKSNSEDKKILHRYKEFINGNIVYDFLLQAIPVEIKKEVFDYYFNEFMHNENYNEMIADLKAKSANGLTPISSSKIRKNLALKGYSDYDYEYKEIKKRSPGPYAYELSQMSKKRVEDYNNSLMNVYRTLNSLEFLGERKEILEDNVKSISTEIIHGDKLCHHFLDTMQSKLERGFNLARQLQTMESLSQQLGKYKKEHEELLNDYDAIKEEAKQIKECMKEQTKIEGKILHRWYRIDSPLGSGGSGVVYKAQDIGENQERAIKEISLSNATKQQLKQIKQECDLLKNLSIYAIPEIFDYFVKNNHFYIVMKYIDGQTLKAYQEEKGKRPPHEIIKIGIQLSTTLKHFHEHQPPVLFCDLKPANVMRTPKGELYVIDFGIARYLEPNQQKTSIPQDFLNQLIESMPQDFRNQSTESESQDFLNQLTKSVLQGTLGYVAPERYNGNLPTKATDIYSLGATLHQLLSGEHPWEGIFTFSTPTLEQRYGKAGSDLVKLIKDMLEFEPEKRPPIEKILHLFNNLSKRKTILREEKIQAGMSDTSEIEESQPPSDNLDFDQANTLKLL